ncbi:hypothetical protein V8G54_036997 [Vigna mungo]|uniref:Uncharacterized protein n=1 Tax=Vigna mungo TaxID=3915 RepID=A0AAQ3RFY9_VIGMU
MYKPASDTDVKATDNVIFFLGETTVPEIRAKIVQPPKAATLATSLKAYFLRQSNPVTTSAMFFYVGFELSIFFWRPWTFLHVCFVAARSSAHVVFLVLVCLL